MTATSQDRFLQTLRFEPVETPWVRWGSFIWDETLAVWRSQGYDGRSLDDIFGLDQLVRVDPWYGPVPEFEHEVIEEDERTVTYVNHEGILMREFKEHRDTSMPQFLRFPVRNEADFEQFAAQRLALKPDLRLSAEWKRQVSAGGRVQAKVGKAERQMSDRQADGSKTRGPEEPQWPRLCWADRWGGFFGPLRNLMGVEGLCCAFYDQPKLVERMMAERADAIIAVTAEVLEHTEFDVFWFWEDMAYNHGPLVGPDMFRKFALPHYRRVCDWLLSQGIRHIGLDSDGDISSLIPIWLDGGVNMLWPFEVQSGMDVVEVRRTYARDLVLMGGIDKRAIAKGGTALRREVDRVMPLIEDGGYIPELDHSVPPDISWPVFCEYMDYLKHRLLRG